MVVPTPAQVVPINPQPPGGGGGGNPPPQGETPTQAPVKSDYDRRIEQERKDLGMNLAAYFKSVGLESLAQWAIQSARDGYTEDWIRLNNAGSP